MGFGFAELYCVQWGRGGGVRAIILTTGTWPLLPWHSSLLSPATPVKTFANVAKLYDLN